MHVTHTVLPRGQRRVRQMKVNQFMNLLEPSSSPPLSFSLAFFLSFIMRTRMKGLCLIKSRDDLKKNFLQLQLQKILKHIAEKQQRDLYGSFNPRAAMFVCNRWDLVPVPERETVLKDTIRKLSRSWPNMDKCQVLFISN